MKKLIFICLLFITGLVNAQTYVGGGTPQIQVGSGYVNTRTNFGVNGLVCLYTKAQVDSLLNGSVNVDGIISGLGLSISGSNAIIQAGSWRIIGVTYSKGTSTSLPYDPQDPTLSRYDAVYADQSNSIHIISGDLATTGAAVIPTIPDNTILVGTILITPSMVTPNPPPGGYVPINGAVTKYGKMIFNSSPRVPNPVVARSAVNLQYLQANYVPQSRTITINGVTQDLSTNRTYTISGGGTTTNAATFNNSGAGASSGTTFDGSAARIISYNTLGAQVAGNYITALSGDIVATGPGSVAATLSNTTVTAGSYTTANITVDAKGRITAASSGSGGGGGTVTSVATGYGVTGGPITTTGTIIADTTSTNGLVSKGRLSANLLSYSKTVLTPFSTQVQSGGTGSTFYYFGDSITLGTGASVTTNCWASLLAAAFGVTATNNGVSGAKASDMNLTLVPTYPGSGYLFIAYGTNDAIGGVSTSTFTTNMQTNITGVLAKSWPANHIVLMTTYGASSQQSGQTQFRANNAAIKSLAASNGTLVTDVYDPALWNLPVTLQVSSDNLHPNDLGHQLIEKLILFKTGATENPDSSKAFPIGVDSTGKTLGIVNAFKNGFILNKTYLNGSLIQRGAVIPSFTYNKTDMLLALGARFISTYTTPTSVANFIQPADGSGNMNFSTNSATAVINTYVSGGTNGSQLLAYKIHPTGLIDIAQSGLIGSFYQFVPTNQGAYINFFDGSGYTTFANTFSGGLMKFGTSGGTNGTTIIQGQFYTNGDFQLQNGGTFTDIASARFSINSTTQGFLKPRMTTTQQNAISSPAEGLEVYDNVLHTPAWYDGTSWQDAASKSYVTSVVNALGAAPTALSGPTVINGTASTFIRSDGAPAINQTAAYDWTAEHIWDFPNLGNINAIGIEMRNNTNNVVTAQRSPGVNFYSYAPQGGSWQPCEMLIYSQSINGSFGTNLNVDSRINGGSWNTVFQITSSGGVTVGPGGTGGIILGTITGRPNFSGATPQDFITTNVGFVSAGAPVSVSPDIMLPSNVWNTTTASTNSMNGRFYVKPVSGLVPTGSWVFEMNNNGAGYVPATMGFGDVQLTTPTGVAAVLSTTSINAKTTGTTALYTVPTGKTLTVTAVYVRSTAATAITVSALADVGDSVNGAGSIYASTSTGLTVAGKTFQYPVGGVLFNVSASGVVNFNVNTAATGTSQTYSVVLMGFLQ